MREQDLERRVGQLEKALTEISEELRLALRYVQPDAGSSLTKSRMILERILLQIYCSEMGHEPRKPLLGDMLADNQFTRKIDRRIVSRMNAIRDMGNLGPHGAHVNESDAARVLEDLCEVLDWYLPNYAKIPTPTATADLAASPARRQRRSIAIAAIALTLAVAGGFSAWLWFRDRGGSAVNKDPSSTAAISSTRGPSSASSGSATAVTAAPLLFEMGLAPPIQGPLSAATELEKEVRVTHESSRNDGTLLVKYRLPYLDKQRSSKAIRGISFKHDTFTWELPRLSVKVLNNSTQSVMLTECIVEVLKSTLDAEPVLAIADGAVNGIMLINEGWGPVVDPVLTFKIQRLNQAVKSDTAERHTLELPTFTADKMVRLTKYVPKELEDETLVAVSGELEFGPVGQRKKTLFTTTMNLVATVEHNVPPSQQYDLSLTAGKAPETHRIAISHNLKPGEADQFLLRVYSDKSAQYELMFRIRTIDGRQLPEQKVVMNLFVPRSAAKRVIKATSIETIGAAADPKQPEP